MPIAARPAELHSATTYHVYMIGFLPGYPYMGDLPARLAGFAEVAAPLSGAAAQAEARRCFTCGFCTMCGNCFTYCPDAAIAQRADWGFEIDLDYCKGCGVCVQECPRSAMSMIPEEES